MTSTLPDLGVRPTEGSGQEALPARRPPQRDLVQTPGLAVARPVMPQLGPPGGVATAGDLREVWAGVPQGRHQDGPRGGPDVRAPHGSTPAGSCVTLTDTNSQAHKPPAAEGSAALGTDTRLRDHRPPHLRRPSPQELARGPAPILPAAGPLFKLPNNLGGKTRKTSAPGHGRRVGLLAPAPSPEPRASVTRAASLGTDRPNKLHAAQALREAQPAAL